MLKTKTDKGGKNTTPFSSLHFLDDVCTSLTFVRVLLFLPPMRTHNNNSTLNNNAVLCPFTELPYGWEEIDDPQYGTYYVE